MRESPLPDHQSEAPLPDLAFDRIETVLRASAAANGQDLHDGHGRSVWIQTERGEFGAKKRGGGSLLYARAHRREWLGGMQAQILRIARDAGATAAPRWTTDGDPAQRPVNFSLAKLVSTRRIAPNFLRLRLSGPDLARLAEDDSIHFRLVQPPAGLQPQWPVIGDRGQTVWPSGAASLHRPPYTVIGIDTLAGWLDTDIFIHPGGRTAIWAQTAQPGMLVGLTGPAGGGIPTAPRLLLAGDETAYPAIARILSRRGDQAKGRVFLLGSSADYPLPDAPGFRITHLPHGESLLAQILRENPPEPADQVWIACERSAAEPLRELYRSEFAHSVLKPHVSAFWTA